MYWQKIKNRFQTYYRLKHNENILTIVEVTSCGASNSCKVMFKAYSDAKPAKVFYDLLDAEEYLLHS